MLNRLIAIAPMLDWTDRHCRYFLRLLSKHVLLYTEMVTANAILHGPRDRLLGFDPIEHPVALQVGGSEPHLLKQCAQIAEDYGYKEVNLNVGCPSDRVQSGKFGACLIAEPNLVADCIAAMRSVTKLPVTVKTRIGIDEQDSYDDLCYFVATVAASGCEVFIIHARKAWLKGLSPKENREVPPLRYDIARQLKRDFPNLTIVLNGGIKTIAQIQGHLIEFDGVMIGREAYQNPYLLAYFDQQFFDPQAKILSRHEVLQQFVPYVAGQIQQGVRLNQMTRHMLGLFQGMAGARAWRRYLSENAHVVNANEKILINAASLVLE